MSADMEPPGTEPLALGQPPPAIDGAVRSAVSQAVVRIHAEHYGKGATQAKTYAWDNVIVTVLADVLTTAERTLVGVARGDTVRDVRTVFQHTMAETFRAAGGAPGGGRVGSFLPRVDRAPGWGVEFFTPEPARG